MTLILGFDTSGPHCSAVLLKDDEVLADTHEDMGRGQAEKLLPLLEDLLQSAGRDWQDLDAIGVGIGPGNFTGIRIAVSAARGLSLSLEIPAVGVSQLEAVALGSDEPVLTCLSAPRDHLYVQGFGTKTEIAPRFLSLDELDPDWAEPGLRCVGTAVKEASERLNSAVAPVPYAPGEAVARVAALRWQDSPDRPAPLYLKSADAAPPRDPAPVILP